MIKTLMIFLRNQMNESSNLMVHTWDIVKESPSLILTIHLANGSKCTKCKGSVMYKIDKWSHFTRKVKSQTSLLQGPQESSLTIEGSIQRKSRPICSSSNFSMDQEDSNNAMENSRDWSCHLRPHWPKDHCSIFTRWVIQLLLSQVITPQAPKPRSHAWGSSIFLLLSSFCLLIWIHRNMLLRFWFWTYHRNVCLISCLHFSFKKNSKIKNKKSKKIKKKIISLQLGTWALKLPSMKSLELEAWAPNDSKFPQGPKPKSPSLHPMLNGHDLQLLLVFKMCIFKKKKKNYVDYFSKEGVLSRLRITLLLEWVKFKILKTLFQIVLKEISLINLFANHEIP